MIETADAVVIGGGILGASTAHFLAKRRFGRVVLLEKRALAAVSTGHSAAVVRTFYSNTLTVKLALRARWMFENDRSELGGDSGFRPIGFLCLYGEAESLQTRQVLENQRANGVEVSDLSPEEITDLTPHLNLDGVVGGIYEPRSGYADPVRTTRSLVESAAVWGLTAYEGVGATGIRLQGGRVAAVETEEGTIETPVVVNAAGPWGRHVGQWVGLNYSVRWSREHDLLVRLPSDFGPFPVTTGPSRRVYFRPDGEGRLLAGLGHPKETEPLDIDSYDSNLEPAARKRILEHLVRGVPALRYAEYVHGWASIYTISDDWHPLVGPEPDIEGYFACFAGSGHCFKLGPPLGEALSAVIAGQAPEIDIHDLRPSRFIEGDYIGSAWGSGNRA